MAKFDVTIWYTVTYSHNVEIEASNEGEAKTKANEIFENANVAAEWGYDNGELDIDIWEVEEDHDSNCPAVDGFDCRCHN
jgi:hypothetical protein